MPAEGVAVPFCRVLLARGQRGIGAFQRAHQELHLASQGTIEEGLQGGLDHLEIQVQERLQARLGQLGGLQQ